MVSTSRGCNTLDAAVECRARRIRSKRISTGAYRHLSLGVRDSHRFGERTIVQNQMPQLRAATSMEPVRIAALAHHP